MNAIQSDIQSLVRVEMMVTNRTNPPFNSAHEGYAVILEELDEVNMELAKLDDLINALWAAVKQDKAALGKAVAKSLNLTAINLACEAVQVAAMCEKLIAFYGKPEC